MLSGRPPCSMHGSQRRHLGVEHCRILFYCCADLAASAISRPGVATLDPHVMLQSINAQPHGHSHSALCCSGGWVLDRTQPLSHTTGSFALNTRISCPWRRWARRGCIRCRKRLRALAAASRIIQGIVTGIGFVGAGVIVQGARGHKVDGLTTAATVWVSLSRAYCAASEYGA